MGYTVNQQGDTVQYNVYAITCDTLTDKDELPLDKFGPGSSVLVLENSSVWIVNSEGTALVEI